MQSTQNYESIESPQIKIRSDDPQKQEVGMSVQTGDQSTNVSLKLKNSPTTVQESVTHDNHLQRPHIQDQLNDTITSTNICAPSGQKMNLKMYKLHKSFAQKGLKTYIGSNKPINLPRHEQVKLIIEEWKHSKINQTKTNDDYKNSLINNQSRDYLKGKSFSTIEYNIINNNKDYVQIQQNADGKSISKENFALQNVDDSINMNKIKQSYSLQNINLKSQEMNHHDKNYYEKFVKNKYGEERFNKNQFIKNYNYLSQPQILQNIANKRKYKIENLRQNYSLSTIQTAQTNTKEGQNEQSSENLAINILENQRSEENNQSYQQSYFQTIAVSQPQNKSAFDMSKKKMNKKNNSSEKNLILPQIGNSFQVCINQITGNIASNDAVKGTQLYNQNDLSDMIQQKVLSYNDLPESKFLQKEDSLFFDSASKNSKKMQKTCMYDPGSLVASTINKERKDFRNPFQQKQSTFGNQKERVNKNIFLREYQSEFRGKYSPPPGQYNTDCSQFKKDLFESKTMTRDMRICPIVSKYQLRIPNVAPNSYQNLEKITGFSQNIKNSKYYGTRAARIVDVRLYGQQNHQIVEKGIF